MWGRNPHMNGAQMRLMRRIRDAIRGGTFPDFIRYFVRTLHPKGDCPQWARDALAAAGLPDLGLAEVKALPPARVISEDVDEEAAKASEDP